MDFGKFAVKLPEIDDEEAEKVKFAPGSLFKQREKIGDKPKSTTESSKNDRNNSNQNLERGDAKNRQETSKNGRQNLKNVNKMQKNEQKAEKSEKNVEKPLEKRTEKIDQNSQKSGNIPLEKLMFDVTFVLSGFENPFRGQLRDKALQMGARYAPDWSKGCTHLVCAFRDTPKYSQVKKLNGKIVKKEWILDSYKERKLLDWKQYSFEKTDEIDDEEDKTDLSQGKEKQRSTKLEAKRKIADAADEEKSQGSPPSSAKKTKSDSDDSWIYDAPTDESEDDVNMETDEEIDPPNSGRKEKPKKSSRAKKIDSDFEFDHEIDQPCSSKSLKSSDTRKNANFSAGLNGSNSSAGNLGSDLPVDEDGLPILPDFFGGFHFLIYENKQKISQAERKQLNRYIVAFDGRLEPFMGPAVSHVISRDLWDQAFDEARAENPNLVFIKTDWVLECGRKERLIDMDPYLIKQ